MIKNRKIKIAAPFFGAEEWNALKGPLASGWVTQGPEVKEFEKAFARMHDARYAVATTSCTTALHLALCALREDAYLELLLLCRPFLAALPAFQ